MTRGKITGRQARMWTPKIGVIIVFLGFSAVDLQGQQSTTRPVGGSITYDAFMKLDSRQRLDQFGTMTPENKAAIMQTHARRWLDMNRGRLSLGQIALVQEAIAFLTPALYRNPQEPEQVTREDALKSRLKCRLRRSDVIEAFGAVRPTAPNSSWFDDLWAWFEDCVLG